MLGTIVNVGTIVAGSLIGGLFRRVMNQKLSDSLMGVMGLAAFGLGINSIVQNMPKSGYPVLFIVSLAVGCLIGTQLHLDEKLARLTRQRDDAGNLVQGIVTLPPKPFSSTDRMVKHVNELAGSLAEHERAIFLQVFQYRITVWKERLRSTHYEEVSQTMQDAKKSGVEFWEVQMDFRPDGVSLVKVERSTDI